MIQSFCEKFLQQKQEANIDQSPLQEMGIQDMEDLKQHYLDEMLSLSKFNGMSIEINKKKELQQLKQADKLSTYTTEPLRRFNYLYDDDDKENSIPLRDIISELPLSVAITPDSPITDSLIMGDEALSTIPEKESDKFIKSSVEDLVPILSESKDTSESDNDCDLPSCDDFSPINVSEEKFVTFSNPLFDSNDNFTSSDDESLSDEDVPEDKFKIYSNPLFEFDDEYISSDVNPLFDEVLENIERKESYVSNLDEPALLVTPLSDVNEDECFDPGGVIDEIDAFIYIDISTDIEDVDSFLPLSLESEDIIFDLGISAFHFSSLEPVAYECPMEVCSSTCFVPNITMIWDCPDYEESRARGFVHHSLDLQSLASFYMGIRYPRSY
ncbi:hypothetical protein Tco_0670235 [Tanacetum coccineum]